MAPSSWGARSRERRRFPKRRRPSAGQHSRESATRGRNNKGAPHSHPVFCGDTRVGPMTQGGHTLVPCAARDLITTPVFGLGAHPESSMISSGDP